jgi:hypothetical protein
LLHFNSTHLNSVEVVGDEDKSEGTSGVWTTMRMTMKLRVRMMMRMRMDMNMNMRVGK